jgi:RNA methyltransferase, TrmH family
MELSRSRERLLRRIGTRRGREAEGAVLLEGPRVLTTALELGAEFLFVLLEAGGVPDPTTGLTERLERSGVPVTILPPEVFREWAETDAPQGILGVAREPRTALPSPAASRSLRVLLLDRIQDPGNVGTLIRSAVAMEVDLVIALDGTADPWGSKAVRASAGLVFGIPVHTLPWPLAAAWLSESGLPLLVADGGGEDVRAWLAGGTIPTGAGWALLVGNEGSGPRPEAETSAHERLAIPLPETVESLNVSTAGALLLWALGPGRAAPTPSTENPT